MMASANVVQKQEQYKEKVRVIRGQERRTKLQNNNQSFGVSATRRQEFYEGEGDAESRAT